MLLFIRLLLLFFESEYRKPLSKNWPNCRSTLHWYIGRWYRFRFITNPWQTIQICHWSWWSHPRMGWRCCKGKCSVISYILVWFSFLQCGHVLFSEFYFICFSFSSHLPFASCQLVNVPSWFAHPTTLTVLEDIQASFHQMLVCHSMLNSSTLNKLCANAHKTRERGNRERENK